MSPPREALSGRIIVDERSRALHEFETLRLQIRGRRSRIQQRETKTMQPLILDRGGKVTSQSSSENSLRAGNIFCVREGRNRQDLPPQPHRGP